MDGNLSPRILITRLSHIGDCILTLPMLNAIRRHRPEAQVFWAVETPTDQLLSLHPGIDEIVRIPKSWAGKPALWRSLGKQLRALQIDISIDPQGITKSAGLGWLSGAKRRIGIRGRWGRELSPWLNNQLVSTTAPHLVDRSLEILSAMGIANPGPAEFRLPLCQESAPGMDAWLLGAGNRGQIDPACFAVINPGGSWASKRWPPESYAAVANYMHQHHAVDSLVVWAGTDEHQMASRIHELAPQATLVCCPTTLRELAIVLNRSQLFIGGDTGPMHLASAVGTPCIGLYGTTRPEESGAYGPQHVAIQKWYQAGSCRYRRSTTNDAMRDILPQDVFLACDQQLERVAENLRHHADPAA